MSLLAMVMVVVVGIKGIQTIFRANAKTFNLHSVAAIVAVVVLSSLLLALCGIQWCRRIVVI